MAIPVWPSINYLHELGSWKLTVSDGKSRTSSTMDNGASRDRRRFTMAQGRCDFDLFLKDDELQRLKSFYKNDLADGTKWFILRIYEGSSYLPHLVKFPPDYTLTASGAGYKTNLVSVSVIVRNPFVVDTTTYSFFDTYGGDLSLALIQGADMFANLSYPALAQGFPKNGIA